MATVVKKAVVASKGIVFPKEIVVTTHSEVTSVKVETPLGLKVVVEYVDKYMDGIKITSLDPKKSAYICSTGEDLVDYARGLTDPQFEEIVAVVRKVRAFEKAEGIKK